MLTASNPARLAAGSRDHSPAVTAAVTTPSPAISTNETSRVILVDRKLRSLIHSERTTRPRVTG